MTSYYVFTDYWSRLGVTSYSDEAARLTLASFADSRSSITHLNPRVVYLQVL